MAPGWPRFKEEDKKKAKKAANDTNNVVLYTALLALAVFASERHSTYTCLYKNLLPMLIGLLKNNKPTKYYLSKLVSKLQIKLEFNIPYLMTTNYQIVLRSM